MKEKTTLKQVSIKQQADTLSLQLLVLKKLKVIHGNHMIRGDHWRAYQLRKFVKDYYGVDIQ